jgi:50S ribosomal protein L16 3-hydroxylase
MDPDLPLPLLGGLTPAQFMRRHWQKRPLLVRRAWPDVAAPLPRAELFELAAQEGVESRLVQRDGDGWRLRPGPLPRRALPPVSRREWTLLVQGLDHHVPAAHALLSRFAFIPHARLDDLMLSWASDGGGVGPHLDSYDVFLLQVHGRRRWDIGRVRDAAFVDGQPLRILRRFEPEQRWVLEPGDLLYLPPRWGHDGVAEGECMTASIGFRAPRRGELARELLLRLADPADEGTAADPLYTDRGQPAVVDPGRIPPALAGFAADALRRALADPAALPRALGEWLTEPKPQVWFDPAPDAPATGGAVRLDARTRMLYDDRHLFVNGESWRVGGRDARLLRTLADTRRLTAADRRRLGTQAQATLAEWLDDGWAHEESA